MDKKKEGGWLGHLLQKDVEDIAKKTYPVEECGRYGTSKPHYCSRVRNNKQKLFQGVRSFFFLCFLIITLDSHCCRLNKVVLFAL